MNNLTQDQAATPASGKRFRLTVRSAEEAVRVIRDKLGDQARVLSVRQVGGEGLKRFISSPKLEVIAEIPADDSGEISDSGLLEEAEVSEDLAVADKEAPSSNAPNLPEDPGLSDVSFDESNDKVRLLRKAGFDLNLLGEIQSWSSWQEMKDKPLADVLKEITVGLSDRFRSTKLTPTTDKIALIGAPGVGKTTTLCKFLAHEVFMNKKIPFVLKVENGIPNPDDALRIFCEVIGVTLFREPEGMPQVSEESPLYLDFPGLSLSNLQDWVEAKQTLDEMQVDTRVLVVNGAYERDILLRSIRSAKHVGATHLAITHFDELSNSTKLWPVLLQEDLSPLCICNGQNVTGDFSTNVLNQLISRTFPEELYARGFSTYKNV
jgi:flagellar biosynthesis protein FlhF